MHHILVLKLSKMHQEVLEESSTMNFGKEVKTIPPVEPMLVLGQELMVQVAKV